MIDALNGVGDARRLIGTTPKRFVSVVTRIELLTGRGTAEADRGRRLLQGFDEIGVDTAVAEMAAALRTQWRLQTPDAIIAATARWQGVGLYTRDAGMARLPGALLACVLLT
nr:PIN domain-containing protein [Polymorphobacter sp.]